MKTVLLTLMLEDKLLVLKRLLRLSPARGIVNVSSNTSVHFLFSHSCRTIRFRTMVFTVRSLWPWSMEKINVSEMFSTGSADSGAWGTHTHMLAVSRAGKGVTYLAIASLVAAV